MLSETGVCFHYLRPAGGEAGCIDVSSATLSAAAMMALTRGMQGGGDWAGQVA